MTDTKEAHSKPFWRRLNKLFLLLVVLPTLISSLYFGLIASDVYTSKSEFVIYNPDNPTAASGLGGFLQGVGLGNNSSYAANAVHNYLLSREALSDIQAKLNYRQTVDRDTIDPLNRFGGWVWHDTTFEQLYRYYTGMVEDAVDGSTNISTLTVRSYTANDAARINKELLRLAQQLVNQINAAANKASVGFYENQVRKAEQEVQLSATTLAKYRNREKIFNTAPQANSQEALVQSLQVRLINTKIQLSQLVISSPRNPQIPLLKNAISRFKREIEQQSSRVTGGPNSLASKSIKFETLTLANSFSEKKLSEAITALAQARVQAQKQQLFIEPIVHPNVPDEALRPKRLRGVLATFVIGLLLWGIFSVIVAGIQEHHDR